MKGLVKKDTTSFQCLVQHSLITSKFFPCFNKPMSSREKESYTTFVIYIEGITNHEKLFVL